MAIIAIQLHRTIRPAQIVFQVYRVVQFDRARINTARARSREFGMATDEARYARSKVRRSSAGVQVRMALRATDVRGYRQAWMSAMFCVARGAGRRENLIRVMQRRVVARTATLVARFCAEYARLLHMAGIAPRCEHRMRCGHPAATINAVVARQRVPD